METRDTEIDPDGVVNLRVPLMDGPPVPLSLVAELRTRTEDTEITVQTTQMRVHLRSSGSNPGSTDSETNTSVMYPGLAVDSR